MSYHRNITSETAANANFRKVLFTGAFSQVVVMCIPVDGEIGTETHAHVEQTFFVQSGQGLAKLGEETITLRVGDLLVVSPNTRHNISNTGTTELKLFTIYSPPNHLPGRIHATKAAADADADDEAFGETVGAAKSAANEGAGTRMKRSHITETESVSEIIGSNGRDEEWLARAIYETLTSHEISPL